MVVEYYWVRQPKRADNYHSSCVARTPQPVHSLCYHLSPFKLSKYYHTHPLASWFNANRIVCSDFCVVRCCSAWLLNSQFSEYCIRCNHISIACYFDCIVIPGHPGRTPGCLISRCGLCKVILCIRSRIHDDTVLSTNTPSFYRPPLFKGVSNAIQKIIK